MRALAFALLVLTLATGCSRVSQPEGSAHAGNAWTHHGLLRIVDLSEPDSLNPLVGNQQIDAELAYLWGGYLFNYNDRDEFVPELATAMPTLRNGGISRDGRTIVYRLRRGVQWQDGKTFGADDVIFTWHAILNKKNNIPSTVGYDVISRIDKRDDHTIVVHLKAAYAPFTSTFFTASGDPYPILPAHLLASYPNINRIAYNSAPIGTGPFTVERWQRGSKIVFRANPHYWRGPPKLREIWYSPVSDENTIVTLLRSHEADLEYHGSASNYAQFRHIDGFQTVLTPFTDYAQLALNVSSAPLRDVRVRRAMWYALDMRVLITDVTHGVDIEATSDQPAFSWAYASGVARYPHDPARARALLDAAGWKVGADGIRVRDGKRLAVVLASSTGSATGNAVNVSRSARGATWGSTPRSSSIRLRSFLRRPGRAESCRIRSSTSRSSTGSTAPIPTIRPIGCATNFRPTVKTSIAIVIRRSMRPNGRRLRATIARCGRAPTVPFSARSRATSRRFSCGSRAASPSKTPTSRTTGPRRP